MYEKAHEIRKEDKRFTAALKGIDIDEGESNTAFEDIKARAEAKALGVSEEAYALQGIINVIDEDDEEENEDELA